MSSTTYRTIQPVVIVYSYAWKEPVNLSEYIGSVHFTRSIAASHEDTAQLQINGADLAELLSPGDWVQIDLYESSDFDWVEHHFFGRIERIGHTSMSLETQSTGITTNSLITVSTWGNVLTEFVSEFKRWMLLKIRDRNLKSEISANVPEDLFLAGNDIPTLHSLVQQLQTVVGKDGARSSAMPTPIAAVQLYMELFVRFGGVLRQRFLMPASWGDGKVSPLHEFIAKLNIGRVGGGSEKLLVNQSENDKLVNFARKFSDSGWYKTDPHYDAKKSAWYHYFDWRSYFDKCPYYPIARAAMDDLATMDQTRPVFTGMKDWSDPGFNELYFGLAEHVFSPGARQSPLVHTHDGVELAREFLPSVTFRPLPHPVYRSETREALPPQRGGSGNLMVKADSTGYDNAMKFIMDVGVLDSFDGARSMDAYRSYWMVKPEGILFGSGGDTQKDDAAIGAASNWRMPILDDHAMNVHGMVPEETYTRYTFGDPGTGSPKAIWSVLTKKTYLSYAWTIRGLDLYEGTFTFPLISHNIPRPGDVGILVGQPIASGRQVNASTLGSIRGIGDGDLTRDGRTKINSLMEQLGNNGDQAFSIYVESVDCTANADTSSSASSGQVTITYSHGQIITLKAPWKAKGMASQFGTLYKRFLKYREVKIDPTWWLPWKFDIGGQQKQVDAELAEAGGILLGGDEGLARAVSLIDRPDHEYGGGDPREEVARSFSEPPNVPDMDLLNTYEYVTAASIKKENRRITKLMGRSRRRLEKLGKNEAIRDSFPERNGQ